MLGLQGLLDDRQQVRRHLVQVYLLAQPPAEGFDDLLGSEECILFTLFIDYTR